MYRMQRERDIKKDANVAELSTWSSVIVPHKAQVIVPSTMTFGKRERKLQQQDSSLLQNPLRSSIMVVVCTLVTQPLKQSEHTVSAELNTEE